MAQEIDFKQDFNDYEDAWKFLKKSVKHEDYVCVNIGYYRRDMSYIDRIEGKAWVNLYRYDLPRALYERWLWVIEWRCAKCKCQHPREDVSSRTCYYDKKNRRQRGSLGNAEPNAQPFGSVTEENAAT